MEKTGNSRLLQMQARFQQRQHQERQSRLVARHEADQERTLARLTASSTSHEDGSQPRQGKVRQMFEERRSKAGIDKSYPLQPIQSNGNRIAPRRAPLNGYPKVAKEKPAGKPSVRKERLEVTNGGGDINHNSTSKTQLATKNNNRRRPEARSLGRDTTDRLGASDNRLGASDNRLEASDNIEDESFPYQLAPPSTAGSEPPSRDAGNVPEKKTTIPSKPAARASRTIPFQSPGTVGNNRGLNNVSRLSPRGPASPGEGPADPPPGPPRGPAMVKSSNQPSVLQPSGSRHREPSARGPSSAPAGEPCSVCGRRFAADRLPKHEQICQQSSSKKRKPYDALKHRLAGTEAEPFVKQVKRAPSKESKAGPPKSGAPLNSSWRQKHEDFIKAIRAAKKVQSHLAAGGKLSDLPPPPPSENPDYIQCPHCNRRFNKQAAERHIPKCADYLHNKPKQAPPRKR